MTALARIENYGNKWWGMLLIVAAPIFLVLSPVLLGFSVFADGFSYTWLQQFLDFHKLALKNGESALWNPLVFSGFPQFISLTGGFFSPVALFFVKILPVSVAYGWIIFVHASAAAFFTAYFLRLIGASVIGSAIGGMAFVFNQWLLIPDLPLASALPYLPLLFILLLRIARREKTGLNVMLGIAAIGLGWFSAHWHYFVELLFAAGIFASYLGFTRLGGLRERLRPLCHYAVMVAGGTVIGLIQLLPTFVYIGLSPRASGFSHWEAVGGGFMPADLITLFLPHFTLPAFTSSPWIFYIGALPFFFFLYAFTRRLSTWAGFFSFLFAVSFLLSINRSVLFWLLHHLPLMNLLHSANRWILVTAFSMAALAGLGFDRFVLGGYAEKRFMRLYAFMKYALVVLIAVVGATTVMYMSGDTVAFFIKQAYGGAYDAYIDKSFYYAGSSLNVFDLRVILPLLFLAAGFFLIRRFKNSPSARGHFPVAVLASVALNFVFVFSVSGTTLPSSALDKTPETVSFLKAAGAENQKIMPLFYNKAFDRFLAPGEQSESEPEKTAFYQSMLAPNLNVKYQLPSAEYMDEIGSRRMMKILSFVRSLGPDLTPEDEERLRRILSFTGVRFALTPFRLQETPSFKKAFEMSATSFKIPVMIYENQNARPLFYFASSVSTIPEDEERAFMELLTMPEGSRKVFVECRESAPVTRLCSGASEEGFTGEGEVAMLERNNANVVLKTSSDRDQFLVFGENNLPGWKAYIDSKESPILTAGSVYMGLAVPAGMHEVKFVFTYGAILF